MSTVDQAVLPAGTWKVDPSESHLGFMARGVWGLVPVKGKFEQFEGELTSDGTSASGELSIVADSLNTKNKQRDTHLRSADFFHVDEHPTVKFTVTGVRAGEGDELQATGVLTVKDKPHDVTFPLHVHGHDDHLHLAADFTVDRAAAGLGWSKAGAIKGPAHLSGEVLLVREG